MLYYSIYIILDDQNEYEKARGLGNLKIKPNRKAPAQIALNRKNCKLARHGVWKPTRRQTFAKCLPVDKTNLFVLVRPQLHIVFIK